MNQFIQLVLQHVLPKGFRRVRDYGFLHGNAKQTLKQVQLALQVRLPIIEKRPESTWCCKSCGGTMHIADRPCLSTALCKWLVNQTERALNHLN